MLPGSDERGLEMKIRHDVDAATIKPRRIKRAAVAVTLTTLTLAGTAAIVPAPAAAKARHDAMRVLAP